MSEELTPDEGVSPSPSFQVRIPLEWEASDSTSIVYANQVMVSHMGPEFFMTFGVVAPPPSTDTLPDTLRIHPQIRVAVSRDAMPAMVKAMQDSLERYRMALAARSKGSGEGS